jgi:glycine cleavage system H lipoate-binding protein
MQCPFLREAQVRQCRSAAVRKQILRTPHPSEQEKCSSPDYVSCPVYREQPASRPAAGRCPYLDESPMQFCAAAPVEKYIPYSESLLSRCGSDRYRFCDLFLALSGPGISRAALDTDGITLPPGLGYSSNHFWFDPGAGDTWHIGIDGFLAKVLNRVEGLSFITTSGTRRPAVAFTVAGVDLQLVFPQPLPIAAVHCYLRARPELLTADPYGQGWLFEGPATPVAGLMEGERAAAWMRQEVERLSRYAHSHVAKNTPGLVADGGGFAGDLLANLTRDDILALFHEFFSSYPR